MGGLLVGMAPAWAQDLTDTDTPVAKAASADTDTPVAKAASADTDTPVATDTSADTDPSDDAEAGWSDEDLMVVTVDAPTAAEELRRSAYVVTVVETEEDQRDGGDLGEVLARKTPVTVQRASGLGSRSALSLGGLGGERLRFFVDGVPIELSGYLTGPANVPVNLVDRVEVYQGVVPIRLAGDALGGAVNLVTDEDVDDDAVSASYQFGSFETHRASVSGRLVHKPSGVFGRIGGFFDAARNNYDVDVTAYNALGQISDVTVPLFHNGYRGAGGNLAVGVANRPWADRLVFQGFLADFHNDVQNANTMERPYGEVTFDRRSAGGSVKYAVGQRTKTQFDVIAGYTAMRAEFVDASGCLFDWYGVCTPRSIETITGEISGMPVDRVLWSDVGYLRSNLRHMLHANHRLRFSMAWTYTDRRGENRTLSTGNDPLEQPRRLTTGVVGAEYEASFLDDRIVNVASLKGYLQHADSQDLLATGEWMDLTATIPNVGGGDTLRVRLVHRLFAKLSYEYATRMPTVDELFGDGMFVLENLELRPETSHNLNLGLRLEPVDTVAGTFRGTVQGMARWSDDLIAQLAQQELLQSVNVWSARTVGVDGGLGYTTPRDWWSIDGRVTYQDLRNRSDEGSFADRAGDRIPNIPYLFSSAATRFRASGLILPQDTVELAFRLRYVHEFLLGWEGVAVEAERLTVPSQLTFGLSAFYTVQLGKRSFTTTVGVDNLTDAKTYDFFGLQRPGRAFFAKWTLQ